MFKRFMIGLIVGMMAAKWYLGGGGAEDLSLTWAKITNWGDSAASGYRGDAEHRAAGEVEEAR